MARPRPAHVRAVGAAPSARASAGRSTTGRRSTSAPGAARSSPRSSPRSSTSWRWACCSAGSSRATPPARGRDVLPRVRRARPGRRARDADRGRRDDLPGHGHDQVAQDLRLDARPRRCSPGTWSARTCCSWRSGWRPPAGVFMLVMAPFGVFETLVGAAAGLLAPAAGRDGVRRRSSTGSPPGCRVRGGLRRALPARACSRCSCSPARSSRSSNLGAVGSWLAQLTPLWHGVNLSRMFCLDNVDWSAGGGQRRLPGRARRLVGWFWSVSGLTKRLVK